MPNGDETAFSAAKQTATITVAAAEVAVGLAIIVALFRTKQSVETEAITKLQG